LFRKKTAKYRLPESKRANYKPYAGIIIAKCSYHFDKNSLCGLWCLFVAGEMKNLDAKPGMDILPPSLTEN
jgi:hypothetical protein